MIIRFVSQCALLGLLVLACGCASQSDVQPVSGTVKFDGQPLAGVSVRFTPVDGQQRTTSRGTTDDTGNFTLRYTSQINGALVGKHVVQVDFDRGEGLPRPPFKIPVKYNRQSELSAEVTANGENTFSFDLTSS